MAALWALRDRSGDPEIELLPQEGIAAMDRRGLAVAEDMFTRIMARAGLAVPVVHRLQFSREELRQEAVMRHDRHERPDRPPATEADEKPTPVTPVSEPLERPAPPPEGEPDLDKKSDREGEYHR